MVANIRGYTPNYNFKLINFDTPRWHTLEYSNWSALDALMLQAGIPNYRGEWLHSTLYNEGDRVQDGEDGHLYRALQQHTSAATGTMGAERAAHPDYWVVVIPGVPIYRGEWIPNASYAQGDIVFVGYDYYLCTDQHLSSPSFATDVDDEWELVFSATAVVNDAETAANNAAASATAADASADAALVSEHEAEQAAIDAQNYSEAAASAQGAFRWNFDSAVAVVDPGVGDMRLNNLYIPSATVLVLSASTMDEGYPDVSDWIVTWDDSSNPAVRGTIYIRKVGAPQNFMVFNITGPVQDLGTWLQIAVTYMAHGGIFNNNDDVTVAFSRAGDRGASGPGGGDMFSANNLSDVVSAPTSLNNLGIGPTSTPTFAQVTVSNAPTLAAHVPTKAYVDAVTTFSPAGGISSTTMGAAIIELDQEKVAKAGDTMSGTLTVTPKGSMFGWAAGTAATSFVTSADANVKMYDGTGENWCGMGTDTAGQFWIRTGTSGPTVPAIYIDTAQNLHLAKSAPTAADHAVRKDYVDTASVNAASGKVNRSGDTMSGPLVLNGTNTLLWNGNSGGYVGSHVVTNSRFYVGVIGNSDAYSIYSYGLNNYVLTVDGPTGVLRFPTGARVPDALAAGDSVVNSNVLESRASAWGAAHAANKLVKTGDTMSGALTCTSTVDCQSYTTVNGNSYIPQAGPGPFQIGGPTHPAIAFHAHGQYGANFGMDGSGYLRIGGWSMGNAWYQIWTSRDFVDVVQGNRLTYVGDYPHYYQSGLAEPYGGSAVHTGMAGYDLGTIVMRYRQFQSANWQGTWYNIGTA